MFLFLSGVCRPKIPKRNFAIVRSTRPWWRLPRNEVRSNNVTFWWQFCEQFIWNVHMYIPNPIFFFLLHQPICFHFICDIKCLIACNWTNWTIQGQIDKTVWLCLHECYRCQGRCLREQLLVSGRACWNPSSLTHWGQWIFFIVHAYLLDPAFILLIAI